MRRPYISWSILQLEEEFDRAHSQPDRAALEALLRELKHRDRARAKALQQRVVQALGVLPKATQPKPELDEVGTEWRAAPFIGEPASATGPITEAASLPEVRAPKRGGPRRPPTRREATPTAQPNRRLDPQQAQDVLAAWTAIEVLSPPQTFKTPANLVDGNVASVVDLARTPTLPWFSGEKARPNTRLFYHIVVGSIEMAQATANLLSVYGDANIDRGDAVGFSPIAVLTVDSEGIPILPKSVAISSFAWGLAHALRRKLSDLGEWSAIEPKLIDEMESVIRQDDELGQALPVSREAIERLLGHLIQRLSVPADCLSPSLLALRVYHYWRAQDPPEPLPMGSFFLNDLVRAKRLFAIGAQPEVLSRFLGVTTPPQRLDLRQDHVALADALAPSRIPAARWPTAGGHALVTLQQAAVNLAAHGGDTTCLMPVNGPPGTGKTTLLRDLVASIVVERAKVMASFDDPSKAFTPSGPGSTVSGLQTRPYCIDGKLRGFETFVVSSNNKAVENVSVELPSTRAVTADLPELRYFKTVADNVARGLIAGGVGSAGSDAWGLFAAVLGNAKNRYLFRQSAWSDQDHGLRAYLLEASGNPQTFQTIDPKTGRILNTRKPIIVTEEKPPANSAAALKRWRSARQRFKDIVTAVEERLAVLERGRCAIQPTGLLSEREELGRRLTKLEADLAKMAAARAGIERRIELLQRDLTQLDHLLAAHDRNKPGLLSRALRTRRHAQWEKRRSELWLQKAAHARQKQADEVAVRSARSAEAVAAREIVALRQTAARLQAELDGLSDAIDRATTISGDRFVDAAFLEREATDLHRDVPWLDEDTQRMREDAFVAAVDLHRTFVDAAAKPIRNNLDLLFRTFFGKSAWTNRFRPLMPDLWASFFCVVPVVSTTFASVDRMLGYLEPGAIGWLLADEAGQAVPQAAVGVLLRARRVVVVGDPLQLPPVTSLPTELADKIAAEFHVDRSRFVAPEASIQTLADASSSYGATIVSDDAELRVGVPLVVHRRCAEPMFSLANHMAYGGAMVQGRGERASAIRQVLGPSAWIDVKPERCEDKWSEAEGRAVVELLRKLDRAGLTELDVYLISPFRIVAQRLRELLVAEKVLSRWTRAPGAWVKERVGTVYTVQGREADTVILVLGAPQPERRGARSWAGQSVNQLNVAVTRAKENLYVVGNRFEWASAGRFAHLEQALP